jgi:predicted nicotinamide N-methyase
MFSIAQFQRTYQTVSTPVTIDGHCLTLFKPASIDRFIDPDDPMKAFPLWARIWEASGLLASHLLHLAPDPQKTMLEIGCGLGLVGIAAAKAGHRVTMTEINPDALNFARANALVNACQGLAIQRLDWNAPQLDDRFDTIIGSETIYRNQDIAGLENLFDHCLKPDGTIVIAESVRRTGVAFWERMRRAYHVQARRQRLRSGDGEHHVVLFRLQRKADRTGP